jgi:protein-disulfide isomerase
MDKRFLGILGGIIIVFIAIFAISQNSNNSSGGSGGGNAQTTNHVEGNNAKGVTLVEYGDYECPICGEYYQPLKQFVAQNINDIHFQFRNLPLTSIHKNALAGARAAEAASLQGKFWEMHDKLYENQDRTGASGWIVSNDPLNEYFVNFAKQIGVKDIDKFKTDYASEKVNDTINADLSAFGKTHQEMATPTFFLDGKYVSNADLGVQSSTNPGELDLTATVANFQKIINAEIDKKTK